MKLAEALMKRSDLQRKQEQISARILLNVKVQEGESPSEDPNDLLKELHEVHEALKELVKRINRTNVLSLLDDDRTLSDAIVERDLLLKTRNHLSKIASEASEKQHRYSNAEIKTISLVDVASLRKQIDQMSKEHRILDVKLQEANWLTDLK